MPGPPTDHLIVRARRPSGVSTVTFALERAGEVRGHAVRRVFEDGAVKWFVTDGEAPPFVVEQEPELVPPAAGAWLLSRPDGGPFATLIVATRAPLDLEVLGTEPFRVRFCADGTLLAPADGRRLGSVDLSAAGPDIPDGAVLELPSGRDPVLRATLLTIPLCVLPVGFDRERGRWRR